MLQAKLSGKNKATSIISVAEGVLASCSDEDAIRLWDFECGENYMLGIHQHIALVAEEVVTSISYNQEKGVWSVAVVYCCC